MTAQGTFLVNGRLLIDARPGTLESALRKVQGDKPGTRITISADAEATHQAVVSAMDVAGKLVYVWSESATIRPAGA